jgi:predicted TIM-barrel fold metal-dependent hydrolase
MIEAMDAAGVDRCVIVPGTWEGDDQIAAFEIAEQTPSRFKIMGRFDPYALDARDMLPTWCELPNMLGIRLCFLKWATTGVLLKDVLEDRSLDWFWAECERLGIPLMCFTQASAGLLAPIARRHPTLRLIVDHVASVAADTVAESFVAIDDLVALAEFPNVYVKASKEPLRSKEPYPFRDVHPVIRKVYDAFGPQRMMWAADLTTMEPIPYTDCLRLWQEGLSFLSAEDKEWILGKTAATVLNWPES